jgi:hypothetical protein
MDSNLFGEHIRYDYFKEPELVQDNAQVEI